MLHLLGSLMGPIFAKEMVEMARRKRYYLNRVFYGAVLLFTIFVVWDNYRWRFDHSGDGVIKIMAQLAESLFLSVSGVQYGAVYLFVPLFLCGVIASEREERTLELLFTTQLRDRQIVLGKLFSRLAALVLLILFSLPVMGMISLYGGVDPDALLRILATTLLAMLYAGAHAIYFSAITKSPIGALVRTYWWMALWLVVVPIILMFVIESIVRTPNHPLFRVGMGFLCLTNPIVPFMVTMEGNGYSFMASMVGWWFFPAAFLVPSGWSLFLIWRAVRRLRLPPSRFGLWLKKLPLIGHVRRLRPEYTLRYPLWRRHWAERYCWLIPVRNPLWLRSRLTRVYDREGHIGRIQWGGWLLAVGFIIFFCLLSVRERHWILGEDGARVAFLVPTWIGVAALTAILAGTSLVGDRRRGFLDLVLMTPLEPRQVIDGTFLAVWQHLRRIYWLPITLAVFFWCAESGRLQSLLFSLGFAYVPTGPPITPAPAENSRLPLLFSLVTALLFAALVILHGTACSLTAKTGAAALVATFALPLGMIVGTPFLIPIFREVLGPGLWLVSALFLVGSWFWVRKRLTVAAVGSYFLAVHLALTSLATCWTWGSPLKEYPVAAMNPGVLTIDVLVRRSPSSYTRNRPNPDILYPCYWTALVVNLVWGRWWLIRKFEHLVERTGAGRPVQTRRLGFTDPHALSPPKVLRPTPASPRPLELDGIAMAKEREAAERGLV